MLVFLDGVGRGLWGNDLEIFGIFEIANKIWDFLLYLGGGCVIIVA